MTVVEKDGRGGWVKKVIFLLWLIKEYENSANIIVGNPVSFLSDV